MTRKVVRPLRDAEQLVRDELRRKGGAPNGWIYDAHERAFALRIAKAIQRAWDAGRKAATP